MAVRHQADGRGGDEQLGSGLPAGEERREVDGRLDGTAAGHSTREDGPRLSVEPDYSDAYPGRRLSLRDWATWGVCSPGSVGTAGESKAQKTAEDKRKKLMEAEAAVRTYGDLLSELGAPAEWDGADRQFSTEGGDRSSGPVTSGCMRTLWKVSERVWLVVLA